MLRRQDRGRVLDRPNSPWLTRMMRDHWGKPANAAQALAAIARAAAELTRERIEASHDGHRERRIAQARRMGAA